MRISNWGKRETFESNGVCYLKIETGFCYKYVLNQNGKYILKSITFKEFNEAYKNKE